MNHKQRRAIIEAGVEVFRQKMDDLAFQLCCGEVSSNDTVYLDPAEVIGPGARLDIIEEMFRKTEMEIRDIKARQEGHHETLNSLIKDLSDQEVRISQLAKLPENVTFAGIDWGELPNPDVCSAGITAQEAMTFKTELDSRQASIDTLRRRVSELKHELSTTRSRYGDEKARADRLLKDIEAHEKRAFTAEKHAETLKEDLEKANFDRTDLSSELTAVIKENEVLLQENLSLKNESKGMSASLEANLRKRISTLENHLEAIRGERDALKGRVMILEKVEPVTVGVGTAAGFKATPLVTKEGSDGE